MNIASGLGSRLGHRLARIEGLPIIVVFLVLIGCFMISAPQVFLGYRIYMSFLETVPPELVLALGLTLIIAAGEIDLSFPSVVALSGFVFSYLFITYGLVWTAALAAIAAGAVVGYINGLIVARLGIPSIIATLATQFLWGGLTTVVSNGLSYNIHDVGDTTLWHLLVGQIGPLPVQSLWALALTVGCWFLLNRHKFGEHLLFIGDNLNVARVVGINVALEKIRMFTLMGVMGAISALLLTLDNKNFFNTQGSGYLLTVIAAIFIGGTSIFGGQGTIVGTFFGAFIIGSIEAGIVATGLEGFWVRAVVGLVFLAAVIFHLFMERPDKARLLRRFGLPAGG